jgi:hypothetical protein
MTIEDLWVANVTANTALVAHAIETVAVCAVVGLLLWLFLRPTAKIARLISLWLEVKERELSRRAQKTTDR